MKLNRLLLRNCKKMTVSELEKYGDRCTGKSLALSMKYLSEAMLTGREVKIVDHYATLLADKHLFRETKDLVERLDLIGFTFNTINNSVKYDIIVEV